jgi:hypothetical protein
MDPLLIIPIIGATASFVSGVAAYIRSRRTAGPSHAAATGSAEQRLDPARLRLTDAEHPDKFLSLNAEELGRIVERYQQGDELPPVDGGEAGPA